MMGAGTCAARSSPAVRGQAPRWSDDKRGLECVTLTPFFLLSKAQVQAFEIKPAPR
jgi:hypothetical protein